MYLCLTPLSVFGPFQTIRSVRPNRCARSVPEPTRRACDCHDTKNLLDTDTLYLLGRVSEQYLRLQLRYTETV